MCPTDGLVTLLSACALLLNPVHCCFHKAYRVASALPHAPLHTASSWELLSPQGPWGQWFGPGQWLLTPESHVWSTLSNCDLLLYKRKLGRGEELGLVCSSVAESTVTGSPHLLAPKQTREQAKLNVTQQKAAVILRQRKTGLCIFQEQCSRGHSVLCWAGWLCLGRISPVWHWWFLARSPHWDDLDPGWWWGQSAQCDHRCTEVFHSAQLFSSFLLSPEIVFCQLFQILITQFPRKIKVL